VRDATACNDELDAPASVGVEPFLARKVDADGILWPLSAGLADEARVRPTAGSGFGRPPVVAAGSPRVGVGGGAGEVRWRSLAGGGNGITGSPVSAKTGSGVVDLLKATVFSTLRLSPAGGGSGPRGVAELASGSASAAIAKPATPVLGRAAIGSDGDSTVEPSLLVLGRLVVAEPGKVRRGSGAAGAGGLEASLEATASSETSSGDPSGLLSGRGSGGRSVAFRGTGWTADVWARTGEERPAGEAS
jgi:hypothetical protein